MDNEPNEFEAVMYCDEDGCTNAALATLSDGSGSYCGDHLRRHTIFAYPSSSYRKAQAEMNDRLLRAEAGA